MDAEARLFAPFQALVHIFVKRAFMVDMLFIESYRLTVFPPEILPGFRRPPRQRLKLEQLRLRSVRVPPEPPLSDLMVNGRLVNNKCGNTMAKKTQPRIYFRYSEKIINSLSTAASAGG